MHTLSARTLFCCPTWQPSPRQCQGRCHARDEDRARANRARDDEARRRHAQGGNAGLPEKGFFKQADPNEPVYKPFSGMGTGDVTQRGGRWESDFIWNTKWQARMDYEESTAVAKKEKEAEEAATQTGFLSFNRVSELNSLDTDLSAELSRGASAAKPGAPMIEMLPRKRRGKYEDPPSPAEAKRWERSSGYTKRAAMSSRLVDDPAKNDEALQAAIQAEADRYAQLQREYSMWTTGTAAVCFAAAYTLYTRDVAASYLVGALGGIVYLRLLNRSIEAVGANSFASAMGGAMGQPRLLIPMVLVLFYNRFNFLCADSTHLHMEFLPMLAGFFTYKVGVLSQGTIALVKELTSGDTTIAPVTADAEGAAADVKSVDRAFSKRVLTH